MFDLSPAVLSFVVPLVSVFLFPPVSSCSTVLRLPLDFVFQGSMLACAQALEVAIRCVLRWTDRGDVIAITTRFVV